MASAKAMPSTARVMTFPKAPGLRPTASEAFMPTSPTPMAEPSPQRPTWMLPLISANIGDTITFPFDVFVVAQRLPRLNTVEPLKLFISFSGDSSLGSVQWVVASPVPPHPNPLPQGEG